MVQANLETWKTTQMGVALFFGMLGKILYQELDKSWLEALIRENVFSDVPFGGEQAKVQQGLTLLHNWADENLDYISEKQFEAVKKDHLYLFTGVGQPTAPVWESVYFNQGRLLFQAQTLQVREWYARFGLQIERFNREPDDHIGLELSFVAHLATLALSSMEAGDQPEAEKNLLVLRDFLSQHLLRWGPAWARLVIEHAETDFYRGLAYLTHGALLALAEYLQIELPREASL